MLKNTFPFTVGYELTALYKYYRDKIYFGGSLNIPNENTKEKNIEVSDNLIKELNKNGYRSKLSRNGIFTGQRRKKFYTDIHCIEIPSPVFTNLKDAMKFYDFCWDFLRKNKFQPKHSLTVCGGNHLHFGISDINLIRAVFQDFVSRPYITWVFTEPDDTDSCGNFTSSSVDAQWNAHKYDLIMTDNPVNFIFLDRNKEDCLTINNTNKKTPTLEFRGVECPKNKKEFLEQLEFFISYVLWIKKTKIKTKNTPKLISKAKLQEIKPKNAIKGFNSLLDNLGLDKKKYSKYIKRNLLPRWELGRKRT